MFNYFCFSLDKNLRNLNFLYSIYLYHFTSLKKHNYLTINTLQFTTDYLLRCIISTCVNILTHNFTNYPVEIFYGTTYMRVLFIC